MKSGLKEIALTTASSSAAFADNVSNCINKHGISPKLANFGVPFGQILYKPGTAIMYWFAAISVAERSGVAISLPWIITVLAMCIVLASATPPVPGGTTASFTNLFGGQCVLLDASMKFGMNQKGKGEKGELPG